MSEITITSPMLTTWDQQNVSGSSTNVGFFPYGWRPNPSGTNFTNIKPGWMCDQTGTYVSAVGDGITDFTITLVSGTFASGTSYSFSGKGGVTFGVGVSIGGTAPGPGPSPGTDNATGYSEMDPPIIPGQQLEDGTATINGSTGFTINNDGATGVAIPGCSVSNQSWFNSNFTIVSLVCKFQHI